MYFGIDIGSGGTKLAYSDVFNPRPVGEAYPSGAAPIAMCDRSTMESGESLGYGAEVIVDGQVYGALIDPDRVSRGMPLLHEDYSMTPEYLALYYGALSRARGNVITHLVTGLPVSHYKIRDKGLALKARLVGTHRIQADREILVKKVTIIPQGYGAYMSWLDRAPLGASAKDTTLIVDFGHYSVDWIFMMGENFRLDASGSCIEGGSFVIDHMAKLVEQRHGLRVSQERLFGFVRDNLTEVSLGRVNLDLKALKAEAARIVAPTVIQRIRSALRDQSTDVTKLLTCGGSTPFFEADLRDAFPNATYDEMPQAVMANAIGYQLWAKHHA